MRKPVLSGGVVPQERCEQAAKHNETAVVSEANGQIFDLTGGKMRKPV